MWHVMGGDEISGIAQDVTEGWRLALRGGGARREVGRGSRW